MNKLLTATYSLTLTAAQIAITATASFAAIPPLNYTCPRKIEVHADQGGPIYINVNGKEAKLKVFNQNYYEAKGSGVTISLSINPDGTPSVSYTGPGRNNGICSESGSSNAGNSEQTNASTMKSKGQTPENLIGKVPSKLKDLVDAKAGQAEDDLVSRGYTYKKTETWDGGSASGKTAYYVENKTGYCVGVATTDGRFSSIVYESSTHCAKK
jgi:hypothetical protein